ncbi:MAG TPA: hypothetical protein VMV94_07045 [Phycisphaerae bacterium]|nr:hypothetical protein [Phycisphaerae bacterium]
MTMPGNTVHEALFNLMTHPEIRRRFNVSFRMLYEGKFNPE